MGEEVDPGDARALRQEISVADRVGAPATQDGQGAFKIRRSYCGNAAQLGLRN